MRITAVDLFCGAGGLTHGLKLAGINVAAGVDLDEACEFAYEINNNAKFLARDVSSLGLVNELSEYFPEGEIRLLAGCAPCQPFSKYRQGVDASKDEKWGLLQDFGVLVGKIQPELVTMENVPQLLNHSVFEDFVAGLRAANYEVDYGVVNCLSFGIPQGRERLILMASKFGPISIPKGTYLPRNYVTVERAIGEMPPLTAGGVDPNDVLHRAAKLSPLNLERIMHSRPGGSWKDWPKRLVADCHKEESGKTYSSVYGRMEWGKPAPTMTTQCYGFGNGRFGHPSQHRGISLREAAIFQSFPKSYRFVPDGARVEMSTVGRMIGNAVPVKLAQAIGTRFMEHVYLQLHC